MKRFAFNERAILAFCHDAIMLVLSWAITLLLLTAQWGTSTEALMVGGVVSLMTAVEKVRPPA